MRTRLVLTTVGLVMVGVASLELLPTSASTGVAPARAPELSIDVDNRQGELAPGDRVTYTIQVHNAADQAYRNVWITHELPAALTPLRSSPAGRQDAELVRWSTTIPAGATTTFQMTGRVGEPRDDYPRVVTTGCVSVRPGSGSSGGQPVTCESDSDALALPTRSSTGSLVLGGIGGAIAVGVLVVRLWPRSEPRPVRPVPARRPYRRRPGRRHAYGPAYGSAYPSALSNRDALSTAFRFIGWSRWVPTDPARGPPASRRSRHPKSRSRDMSKARSGRARKG